MAFILIRKVTKTTFAGHDNFPGLIEAKTVRKVMAFVNRTTDVVRFDGKVATRRPLTGLVSSFNLSLLKHNRFLSDLVSQ